MKLDIVEACRIRSVVGTARLRKHLPYFGIRRQFAAHPVCQLNGLIQGNTLRQGGTDINRTFVQLRKKLSPQQSKTPQTNGSHQRSDTDSCLLMCMATVKYRNRYPVYPRQKRIMPFTHIPFQQHRRKHRD